MGFRLLLGLTVFWMAAGTAEISTTVLAAENSLVSSQTSGDAGEETQDPAVEKLQSDLLSRLELDQIQKLVDQLLGSEKLSFRESLKKIINGEQPVSEETAEEFLRSLFFSGWQKERELFIKLLFLILAAALLSSFTSVFDSGQTGEISFYVGYLLLFVLLMDAFYDAGRSLRNTISWMAEFMKALAPAYFITVAASAGAATAAVFYEGVLVLAWLLQWLLLNLLFPAAHLYILLRMVNHLSREEMLGKLSEFLNTLISWGLRSLLGVVAGLKIVRGLVAPVMDSLKRSLIGRAAGALPAVGNAVNMVTELVLTSAVLVRNSMGVMLLMVFVLAGAGPVVHYGALSLGFRLLAAASQPVSDKRIVECLSTMGEGFGILLRILFTAEILCILTFLIIMAGIQGGAG